MCCPHATPHCEPIKKSATSIEHGTALQIYNALPSANPTQAPHSPTVTPISILSSHYNYPAASDNSLSTGLVFPSSLATCDRHLTVQHASDAVTGCAVPDISQHLLGMLQPNMKALNPFKTSELHTANRALCPRTFEHLVLPLQNSKSCNIQSSA